MFGVFKKTSWKIEDKVLEFFEELFSKLPEEFYFLSSQLEKGLYLKFRINRLMKENHYSISFDSSMSDENMSIGKNVELENISINTEERKYFLNISIYDGLWIGFESEINIKELNEYELDLSGLKETKNPFSSNPNIEKLVNDLTSDQLELGDLSELEVEGKLYYRIKDLEDGNSIAIDIKGQVFVLIHDPYKIELINNSVRNFVKEVNNRNIDFDNYLKF